MTAHARARPLRHGPSADRGSGPVWSRTPSALRSSVARDRIGRPGRGRASAAAPGPAGSMPGGDEMTAEVCLMVLVLAVTLVSFLFDLYAYWTARKARQAKRY